MKFRGTSSITQSGLRSREIATSFSGRTRNDGWERLAMTRGNKIKKQKLKIKMTDKNAKFITEIFGSLKFEDLNLSRI